ncbi:MAG: hypothetical protein ABSA96_01210 [Candidatus Acidiferrales bacterium]
MTVAFGTDAPEESLTVPTKAPVEDDWLNSNGANNVEKQIRTTQLNTTIRHRERGEAIVGK